MGPVVSQRRGNADEYDDLIDDVEQQESRMSFEERQVQKKQQRDELRIANKADQLLARGASFDTYISYLASTETSNQATRSTSTLEPVV
jgi:hypothetical protein